MSIALTPYLRFDGTAREAAEFYRGVFGGELSILTFGEGMGDTNTDTPHLVMHASLYLERGVHIMVSDVAPGMSVTSNGTVCLSSNDSADGDAGTLKAWWESLLEDADVEMALEQAPWGDYFGQLKDKFGVTWMMNIPASPA